MNTLTSVKDVIILNEIEHDKYLSSNNTGEVWFGKNLMEK